MARNVGLSFVLLLLILASAWAIPARPPYVPDARVRLPTPVYFNVSGTAWLGKYNTINRIYILEPDGTVSYKTTAATATIFRNRGHWRLEGNRLFFEYFTNPNNKLMEFRGVLTNANTIVGEQLILSTQRRIPTTMTREFSINAKAKNPKKKKAK